MTVTAKKLYSIDSDSRVGERYEKLEREFFSMIRVNGKVNKTTWANRLIDVDERLEHYIRQHGLRPLEYLDVGVSSGISTWDWYKTLTASGRPFRLTATDLVLDAFLMPVGYHLKVLVDRYGVPLQYDFLGYGIRPGRPRPRDWATGTVLASLIVALAYKKRCREIGLDCEKVGIRQDCSIALKAQSDVRFVRLISPRLPDSVAIDFVESDVLRPLPENMKNKFDVVRVANLINADYFSHQQMKTICQRLKRCMVGPSSLLVICRTREDGSNHGTIFRLSSTAHLVPVRRLGEGSEIEALVVEA